MVSFFFGSVYLFFFVFFRFILITFYIFPLQRIHISAKKKNMSLPLEAPAGEPFFLMVPYVQQMFNFEVFLFNLPSGNLT